LVSTQEIGRLNSGKATVIVASLAVADPATKKPVRGLRLSISSRDWSGIRYIDDVSLPGIKEKLEGLVQITARLSGRTAGNHMVSTECPGEEGKLPLVLGYHYGNSAPELIVGGPTFPDVIFTDVTPSQLAEILVKAIDQLMSR
jgi:hypothetical protein